MELGITRDRNVGGYRGVIVIKKMYNKIIGYVSQHSWSSWAKRDLPISPYGEQRSWGGKKKKMEKGTKYIFNNKIKTYIMKYSRNYSSKDNMPAGIKKLEQLGIERKDKYKNLKEIISDIDVLKAAYAKIKTNKGAMTSGTDGKTLDGISNKIFEIIQKEINTGAYKFKPAKIVEIPPPYLGGYSIEKEIPKSNGGKRKLGIPCAKDKIVQEVMRMVLEMIYEKEFKETSHGFRTKHSCHTALNYIRLKFGQMKWYIEGDISKCFDSFNHKLLINKLELKIQDQTFMDLMYKSLKAGYIEQGLLKNINLPPLPGGAKLRGTPQGSVLSPILANIYLNDLDIFMKELKEEFDKGKKAKANPEYTKIMKMNKLSKLERLKLIHKNKIETSISNDPNFRRIQYVRYTPFFWGYHNMQMIF